MPNGNKMQYQKIQHKILCNTAQNLYIFIGFVDFFINIEYNIRDR